MGMTPTLPPDDAARKSYYETGAWGTQTIYDIVCTHRDARPDAPAVTDSTGSCSWRDLVDAVDAFAADLAGRGLVAGDTIFVGATNRVETVIALLAASRDGFVCCTSPHRNHTV
ncbi:unnamed protein product, partial [Discosporangium mesarthrocarpum]